MTMQSKTSTQRPRPTSIPITKASNGFTLTGIVLPVDLMQFGFDCRLREVGDSPDRSQLFSSLDGVNGLLQERAARGEETAGKRDKRAAEVPVPARQITNLSVAMLWRSSRTARAVL